MNYSDLVATISNLTVISATEPNFVQILPQAITYAEDRIYRELDLLSTVARAIGQLTAGNRNCNLTSTGAAFIVTSGFNVITPSTTTDPNLGTRHQMVPTSRDFLDAVYGSAAGAGLPQYYAPITDQLFVLGPWPDQNYTIEVIGTIQPATLSSTNATTSLSLNLPDLLTAAVMIFMSGYQQNFGAQADNPQMATSWESQYDKLFASANVVEFRKKYQSGGWASQQPTTIATPSR